MVIEWMRLEEVSTGLLCNHRSRETKHPQTGQSVNDRWEDLGFPLLLYYSSGIFNLVKVILTLLDANSLSIKFSIILSDL